MSNKVLIVCSGNSHDDTDFDIKRHHAFIYEQAIMVQNLGVEFDFFYIKGKGIAGYFLNWYRLWHHLRKHKYAVIHAHNGLSGLIAVLQPFYKTIITFHGSDINQKKTRLISNFVCLMANYSIFVSSYLYEKLYFRPHKNYSVIPCGINLDTFYPVDKIEARRRLNLNENQAYVLFSSYFSNTVKNYPLAKLAMSLVPEAQLLELKNKSREDVNLLLNAVDVLLLTSLSEGSPQVIKEAMACNCPIVTTNVGDVMSIINKTDYCYVCAANPEEIAEELRYLLNSSVRTKGCESISAYDNKIIAKKILNIYRRFGISGNFQRCTKGLWDTTVPGIKFDDNGVSNYCQIHESLMKAFVRGDEGKKHWLQLVAKIKQNGLVKKYDCIIGVSGGTDSSYLMHLSTKYGLHPLAVNLDNGWSSDISVKNIKKVTSALNIDLETYVIDYEEVKDVLRSQMMAGLPWIDAPTDYAIMSVLYKIARREGVKYILTGSDFRSEGKQPTEWTYTDNKQIKTVHKRFGKHKLRTFPLISFGDLLYLGFVKQIKAISPFNYIDYQKKNAQKVLKELYGWEYYGGHHHENLFTKFAIAYWLPKKFGIDKRLITLSAQIMSGEISRDEALEIINYPSYSPDKIEKDKEYVIKKLGFSEEEFMEIWNSPNKSFQDYSSNYPMIKRFVKLIIPIVGLVLPQKPKIFFEMDIRS
jgi:N-acetyl sugar amidotransferase